MCLCRLSHWGFPDLRYSTKDVLVGTRSTKKCHSPGSAQVAGAPSGTLGWLLGWGHSPDQGQGHLVVPSPRLGHTKQRQSRHGGGKVHAQSMLTSTVLPLELRKMRVLGWLSVSPHCGTGTGTATDPWIPQHRNEPCTTGGKRHRSSPSKHPQASLNTSPAKLRFFSPGRVLTCILFILFRSQHSSAPPARKQRQSTE